MTSPTATAEIERLAREASKGPWRDTPFHWGRADVLASEGQSGKPAGSVNGIQMDIVASDLSFHDAAYIAAVSPDVVLGILAALRAAEARAQHAEKYMRDWRQGDLQGVMVHLDAAIARAEAAEAERERMREALDIAVSRGCDHCAESIRKARAALQSTTAPQRQERT